MSLEIQEFLNEYLDVIAEVSLQLRTLVLGAAPSCSETLHTGWKVISYGHKKKFCAIAPFTKWVNLQFHSGSKLTDPDELLEGNGRSMRHVRIRQASDLDDSLVSLVQQASLSAK